MHRDSHIQTRFKCNSKYLNRVLLIRTFTLIEWMDCIRIHRLTLIKDLGRVNSLRVGSELYLLPVQIA
jgi:hypothetical protein